MKQQQPYSQRHSIHKATAPVRYFRQQLNTACYLSALTAAVLLCYQQVNHQLPARQKVFLLLKKLLGLDLNFTLIIIFQALDGFDLFVFQKKCKSYLKYLQSSNTLANVRHSPIQFFKILLRTQIAISHFLERNNPELACLLTVGRTNKNTAKQNKVCIDLTNVFKHITQTIHKTFSSNICYTQDLNLKQGKQVVGVFLPLSIEQNLCLE